MKNDYEYAYAIIRVDEFQGPDCPIEHKITVKKVVLDEELARHEVERLNELRRNKPGTYYFSQVTRLERNKAALVEKPTPADKSQVADSEDPLFSDRTMLRGSTYSAVPMGNLVGVIGG